MLLNEMHIFSLLLMRTILQICICQVIIVLDRLNKEREESRNSLYSTDDDDEWDDVNPDDGDIIYVT
jgi:hypothetical protein